MEQPQIFNFLTHFESLPCSCQVQHDQVLPHTLQQLHCRTDRERNQNPQGRAAMPGGREKLLLEILILIRRKGKSHACPRPGCAQHSWQQEGAEVVQQIPSRHEGQDQSQGMFSKYRIPESQNSLG